MRDPHSLRATPLVKADPTTGGGLGAMLDDAWLDEEIAPRCAAGRDAQPTGLKDARRILLTGATGFLGRWVAKELVDSSPAILHCLVRPHRTGGWDRLCTSLTEAGVSARVIDERVRVIDGDLSQPRLGLSEDAFLAIGGAVDAVCQVGAVVNWTLPYSSLQASNVESTRDLIELACRSALPFHFVSSLSVCYSTAAPRSPAVLDHTYDPLPHLAGLHLGYAQSKVVAETLVREAGRRGLPVSIYRPSLVAGHSVTGAFNGGDIVARVLSGCIRMGVAPDLDWQLDCVPVDTAARLIVDLLSGRRGVHHLRHDRPRSWRECVLWMRLAGYDIRLVPYHTWLHRLERETADADRSHPLRALRAFFLNRRASHHDHTQLELLIGADLKFGDCHNPGVTIPALDAELLQRYFDAFVAAKTMPPATRTRPTTHTSLRLDEAFFSEAIGTAVTSAKLVERLSEHSIISDLTSWQSGEATGLFRYQLGVDGTTRSVVVKAKSPDRDAIAVGGAIASVVGDRLGVLYERWARQLGLAKADERELAIYTQGDPRFTTHAPALLGWRQDSGRDGQQLTYLVLEDLRHVHLKDATDQPERWGPSEIEAAIDGAAALHAIWLGRNKDLESRPWIGHIPSAARTAVMGELWDALAAHAAPRFSAWAGPAIATTQRRLVETIDEWWPVLDALPRTLIHNDFNPRNICFRRREGAETLVAYDWELATVGVPQHDLAELLCFVLPENSERAEIETWIERHRERLQVDAGIALDAGEWARGFRAALRDLLLARLPLYTLIHRIRRQPFLPRIVRNWQRIYTCLEG